MSDLNFFNPEKYITNKILKINGITELLSSKERISHIKPIAFRSVDYSFGTTSFVVLEVSVTEMGFVSAMFVKGEESFFLDSFLKKHDPVSSEKRETILKECRKNSHFKSNLDALLDFLVDYINNCSDLQLVLAGQKWFNIPYDFGGMK